MSARTSASRLVALGAAGLLTLGLAQAPASAADQPSSDRDTLSRLQELGAMVDRGAFGAEGRAVVPRRLDVVTDPRGDAERLGTGGRGARPYTRLADVTRARYKTPSTEDGDLRITTRWNYLADGSREGTRRQEQVTIVAGRRNENTWAFVVYNTSNRVRLFDLGEGGGEERIRPRKALVTRSTGQDGTIDVVLSSEWIDVQRVAFQTFTYSGFGRAFDDVESSIPLRVGPVDR